MRPMKNEDNLNSENSVKKYNGKLQNGTELIFYCQIEFCGPFVTNEIQISVIPDILKEFFEKLKERVEILDI